MKILKHTLCNFLLSFSYNCTIHNPRPKHKTKIIYTPRQYEKKFLFSFFYYFCYHFLWSKMWKTQHSKEYDKVLHFIVELTFQAYNDFPFFCLLNYHNSRVISISLTFFFVFIFIHLNSSAFSLFRRFN